VASEAALRLAEWSARMLAREGVRVVPAENLHLTLWFLGQTEDEVTAALAERVAARPWHTIRARTAALAAMGRGGAISLRILASDEGWSGGEAWVASVLGGAAGAGAYMRAGWLVRGAHVTLARAKAAVSSRDLPMAPVQVRFNLARACLFESELSPGGSRYRVLAEAPLATG